MDKLQCKCVWRPQLINIRAELRRWLDQYPWDIAATMTFADEFTERQAARACCKFWNEVDYHLFKNASRRYNKKCQRVMMIEGDGLAQHYHLHGAICTPKECFDSAHRFCAFLESRWLRMFPRFIKVEFKPVWHRAGWNWYITKEISVFDCDRFDVHSSHIAAPNSLTASRANTGALTDH